MRTMYIGRAAWLTLVAAATAVVLAGGGPSLRPLDPDEAACLRGGQNTCVDKVFNTGHGCKNRTFPTGAKTLYKCTGQDLDQDCQGSTQQTNNKCDTGSATCSGTQYISTDWGQTWTSQNINCNAVTYTTARLASDTSCVPAQP
jgi:hypothetical protein